MLKLKIGLCQQKVYPTNIETNAGWIEHQIKKIDDVDILIFPEMSTWGPPLSKKIKIPPLHIIEEILSRLRKICNEYQKRAIIGALYPTDKGIENRAYILGENNIQYYTKTHIHWTENFIPGNNLPIFRCCGIPVGCLICYDLAFPESARILALKGAQIIFAPSAVPDNFNPEYIKRRLQGLSIENQLWIIYVNRCDPGFNGHSAVYSPRGECIIEANSKPQILKVSIDLDEVIKWRQEERIIPFRRPELYGDIIKL